MHFDIDADIHRARTPPAEVYGDPAWYARQIERVFARGWHLALDEAELPAPGAVRPVTLLEGSLDEPLLWTRGEDGVVHCLSNACTHRGNPVAAEPATLRGLRCRYHG